MTLSEIRELAMAPALAMLPARMNRQAAIVEILAIGMQESRFEHRRQTASCTIPFHLTLAR